MKEERILPYGIATKLSHAEAEKISGAGTSHASAHATYSPQGGTDVDVDVEYDM